MVGTGRLFLLLLALLPPLFFITDSFVPLCFRFNPQKLQELSRQNIARHGNDTDALIRNLITDLQAEYPGLVGDYDKKKWVFNVAGGATGAMIILHASITEYLLIFGSASGTEGHSGAHFAHDYFTILSGRQTAGFLGELAPRVYLPGDQHHHPRFNTAHYTLDNSSWALELAQGIIPAMFPFGLVQMPMSFDIDSTWRTIYYTGKDVIRNLLQGKI